MNQENAHDLDRLLERFIAGATSELVPPFPGERLAVVIRRANGRRAALKRAILSCGIAALCLSVATAAAYSPLRSLAIALQQAIAQTEGKHVVFKTPVLTESAPTDASLRRFFKAIAQAEPELRWSVRSAPAESLIHGAGGEKDIYVVVWPSKDHSQTLTLLPDTTASRHYRLVSCSSPAYKAMLLGSGISTKQMKTIFETGSRSPCK